MSFEQNMKAAHAAYFAACNEEIEKEYERLIATGLTEQEAASMVALKSGNVNKELQAEMDAAK